MKFFWVSLIYLSFFYTTSALALSVSLEVHDDAGIARTSEPVTSGIPLPQGLIFSDQSVKINGVDGQFKSLSTWPDGSIRWLLCDFQATVAANGSTTYTLTDGTGNATGTNLSYTESSSSIVVRTGVAEFAINKNNFNLFDSVKIDKDSDGQIDDVIVSSATTRGAVFTNESDKAFYSGLSTPASISIEESGPMRLVVLAKGKHKASDNSETIDYTIRMHFYNNKSYVRVFYTLTNKESAAITSGIQFNDISINTKLNLTGTLVYAFGGSSSVHAGNLPAGESAYIYQYGQRDDGATGTGTASTIQYILGGVASGSGAHAIGWADLSDSSWGLTTVIKNFWQLYPKAQYVDSDGNVSVKLWPSYNSKASDGTADVLWAGAAKTHEVLFYFHAGGYGSAASENISKAFNNRLCAEASSDWYVDSKAFGDITTTNISQYQTQYQSTVQAYEQKLEEDFDYIINQRESDHWTSMHQYGMWHFGDSRQAQWSNHTYDAPYCLFRQYVRSGAFKYFKAACEGVEHYRDIDIIHYYPGSPQYIGTPRYLPNNGTMHDMGQVPQVTYGYNLIKNRGLVYHYFLTGDKLSYDIAKEVADNVKNYWLRYDRDNILYDPRQNGTPGWALLAMYEATGDSDYLNNGDYVAGNMDHGTYQASMYTVAYKTREWANITPSDPNWGYLGVNCDKGMKNDAGTSNSFGTGMAMDAAYRYYELTNDDNIKQMIIDAADWLNNRSGLWTTDGGGGHWLSWSTESGTAGINGGGLVVGWMGHAYGFTGNSLYLTRGITALQTMADSVFQDSTMEWKAFGERYNTVPEFLYYLLDEGEVDSGDVQGDVELGSGGGGGGGCFIATAIYGSPKIEEVQILCSFREKYLLTNKLGKVLVKYYYKISPPISDYIEQHRLAKNIIRTFLKPIVWLVKITIN